MSSLLMSFTRFTALGGRVRDGLPFDDTVGLKGSLGSARELLLGVTGGIAAGEPGSIEVRRFFSDVRGLSSSLSTCIVSAAVSWSTRRLTGRPRFFGALCGVEGAVTLLETLVVALDPLAEAVDTEVLQAWPSAAVAAGGEAPSLGLKDETAPAEDDAAGVPAAPAADEAVPSGLGTLEPCFQTASCSLANKNAKRQLLSFLLLNQEDRFF